MGARRAVVVALVTAIVSACSAAGPLVTTVPNREPEAAVGVVNGVWRYDQNENAERMRKWHSRTDEGNIAELSQRYQVRVGIRRSGPFGDYAEVAVLPAGWVFSQVDVIDDGKTVNVGDIVEIENKIGTNLEFLQRIVRKCNATPVTGERSEWKIGCKAIHTFDEQGYGGEHYGPLTSF